ncbi:hypothetical protein C9J85_03120 [Haloferax sp. wsp5]|nr:hypothetical protein C9J85_03120 [Haloferax sp. wsp5]
MARSYGSGTLSCAVYEVLTGTRSTDGDRDDRPDWATLTECDLQALADGDARPSAPAGPETCTVSKPSTWRPHRRMSDDCTSPPGV